MRSRLQQDRVNRLAKC